MSVGAIFGEVEASQVTIAVGDAGILLNNTALELYGLVELAVVTIVHAEVDHPGDIMGVDLAPFDIALHFLLELASDESIEV